MSILLLVSGSFGIDFRHRYISHGIIQVSVGEVIKALAKAECPTGPIVQLAEAIKVMLLLRLYPIVV